MDSEYEFNGDPEEVGRLRPGSGNINYHTLGIFGHVDADPYAQMAQPTTTKRSRQSPSSTKANGRKVKSNSSKRRGTTSSYAYVLPPNNNKGTKNVIGEDIFLVESILDKRFEKDGTPRYLIKWEGYSSQHNTWEPTANISGGLVKRYEENKARAEEIEKTKWAQTLLWGYHTTANIAQAEEYDHNPFYIPMDLTTNSYETEPIQVQPECAELETEATRGDEEQVTSSIERINESVQIQKETEYESTAQSPLPALLMPEETLTATASESTSQSELNNESGMNLNEHKLPEIQEGYLDNVSEYSENGCESGMMEEILKLHSQEDKAIEGNEKNMETSPVVSIGEKTFISQVDRDSAKLGVGENVCAQSLVRYDSNEFRMIQMEENVADRKVKEIHGITNYEGQFIFLVTFEGMDDYVVVRAPLMNAAFPQEVINFYENKTKWFDNEDDEEEEGSKPKPDKPKEKK